MSQMLAAFYGGPFGSAQDRPYAIEVRQTPVSRPDPGQVLVRVRACGICGSDLHFYRGEFPSLPNVSPGHEFAGEIAALGDGVQGWSAGQRVAVEPLLACRQCSFCGSGQYQLCHQRKVMGMLVPGGMAQYVCVPAYGLHSLPDGLDFELGALAEPLAVAVHALHVAGLEAGQRLLVLGSGSLGLLVVLAARAAGAGEVIATYRHGHQGETALALGAHTVLAADEAGSRDLSAPPEAGQPVDIVVETVGGGSDTLGQALNLVRPGGRVIVLGVFTRATSLNALLLTLKEVRMVGCSGYCHPGTGSDFDTALGIIAADPERVRRAVSHRFPLSQAADAYAVAADKSSRSLKVLLLP